MNILKKNLLKKLKLKRKTNFYIIINKISLLFENKITKFD
jgi:hypothetical protein